jgi:ABC-2 type transport system ATP-binding protein
VKEGVVLVEARNLTVRYPDFTLGPLSLTLRAGERVALVGPNGAGKSTTIKAICGLLPTYEGRAAVEGREVRDAGPGVRARVGVLPERLLGFGWTTVADHLRFLSAFYPTWDAGYAEDLRRLLEVPERTKLAHLSKGMQVRLSLVAAEAFRPPVILLDEPTSGIDPLMRGEILALIKSCASPETGRAVLFSSHILEDIEEVAERVVLLRGGRVLADLSREDLRREAGDEPISKVLYRRLAHG